MSSNRRPAVSWNRAAADQRPSTKYPAIVRSTGTGWNVAPVMKVLPASSRWTSAPAERSNPVRMGKSIWARPDQRRECDSDSPNGLRKSLSSR